VFIGTEKVIPSKHHECKGTCRPSIAEKQDKVFHISSSNAVVHPRTMMVHASDTPVADSTVMRSIWFVALTPRAHGVCCGTVRIDGDRGRGYCARIRKGGFDVTGQGECTEGKVGFGEKGWQMIVL
jgi:hypothetical protein